jgi:hypothetical protein
VCESQHVRLSVFYAFLSHNFHQFHVMSRFLLIKEQIATIVFTFSSVSCISTNSVCAHADHMSATHSLSVCVSLSRCLIIRLSFSHCLSLSLSLDVSFSHCLSLSLSPAMTNTKIPTNIPDVCSCIVHHLLNHLMQCRSHECTFRFGCEDLGGVGTLSSVN